MVVGVQKSFHAKITRIRKAGFYKEDERRGLIFAPLKLCDLVPEAREDGSETTLIEKQFPHISDHIEHLWSTLDCLNYLEELMHWHPTPERPERQGFPLRVIMELGTIYRAHILAFPDRLTNRGQLEFDNWHIVLKMPGDEK